MWGATAEYGCQDWLHRNFNPRSPCVERQPSEQGCHQREQFQSTLPMWGATVARLNTSYKKLFQSTLPMWGATRRQIS